MTRLARLAGLFLLLPLTATAQQGHRDPALVQGPTACGECHEASVEAWRSSHHFRTFRDMPRSDEAREIADRLGIRRIKSESDCLGCHFTLKLEPGEGAMPVAGISCESCHGAGRDWIDVHSDFGGKDLTADDESPQHRLSRWQRSTAAGMIRPENLYELARNCYRCHSVPNEKLVNDGGHAAGSDIELVAWTQGEVRHNVWYNDARDNPEAGLERRRLMFVVGRMLDLEYALRGIALATVKADYALSMAKRARRAALGIKALSDAGVDAQELRQILAIAGSVKVSLNNEDALTDAAERISRHARSFAATADGAALEAVDALLPTPDQYQGEPWQP